MSTVNKSTLVIVKNAHIALLNFNKFIILSCLNENCANSTVGMKKKKTHTHTHTHTTTTPDKELSDRGI